MSKFVDEPASNIRKRLLAGELRQLDSRDRTVWARFMMAQVAEVAGWDRQGPQARCRNPARKSG
jgi:hypothetical protein